MGLNVGLDVGLNFGLEVGLEVERLVAGNEVRPEVDVLVVVFLVGLWALPSAAFDLDSLNL